MFMKVLLALFVGAIAWKGIKRSNAITSENIKRVHKQQVYPMNIGYELTAARSSLNIIRTAMGMLDLTQNENLDKAAQSHANYMVQNQEPSHYEIKEHPGFTGEKPVDRAIQFGYHSLQVSENVSTAHYTAQESIEGLFSAIYHRFGFLSTTIDEIGIGISQDQKNSDNSAFSYLMGNNALNRLCQEKSFTGYGKYVLNCKNEKHRIKEKTFLKSIALTQSNNPKIIVYPYENQTEVPPVFYNESPDPLPNYDVSGFPISVMFNSYYYKKVTLLNFTLSDTKGNPIRVKRMDSSNDPNHIFTDNQFALFPLARLAYNTSYNVDITYKVKGITTKKHWTFSTISIKEDLIQIDKTNEQLILKAHKDYVLYFPPLNIHDLITDLEFPEGISIVFLDHNTIRMTVISDDIDNFVLDTGKKRIEITVEQ